MKHLLFSLLLAVSASQAHAQSFWYVDAAATAPGSGTLQDPYASLAFAVDQASTLPGDVIFVAPGIYAESVDLGGKDLRILGENANDPVVFLGDGQNSVFRFTGGETSECFLNNIEIRGTAGVSDFNVPAGEGIFIDGASPTLSLLRFVDCAAARGGAVAIRSGAPTMNNCEFSGNVSAGGGAVYLGGGSLQLEDCTFTGNQAVTNSLEPITGGGAIATEPGSSLVMRDTLLEFNGTKVRDGGALLCLGTGWLENCSFENNTAGTFNGVADGGGALVSEQTQGHDCTFDGNGWLYTSDG